MHGGSSPSAPTKENEDEKNSDSCDSGYRTRWFGLCCLLLEYTLGRASQDDVTTEGKLARDEHCFESRWSREERLEFRVLCLPPLCP